MELVTKDALKVVIDAIANRLNALTSGQKIAYSWDSLTRVVTFSNIKMSNYKFYYRKSTGVLGELTPTGHIVMIPSDASSVIEMVCVDGSSNNKSLVII